MKNGFLAGAKAGWVPAALGGLFAAEVEYAYQRAEFDKIMSPGFEAGPHTIAGFYSPATDSHIEFQSLFLNLLVRYPAGKVHPYAGFGPGVTRCSVSFNEAELTTEGFGFAESGDDTAFCWQALAGVWQAQGKVLRAVRAEAEAQVARYDYAAAVDRFKAGQALARTSREADDFVEASIIDTRLRAVESLLREQAAER